MRFRTTLLSTACLALGVSIRTFAQTSPIHEGSWLVGGGASLTRTHTDDGGGTTTQASLVPTGLVSVNSRLAVGGTLLLAYDDFGAGHALTYGIGPAARLYLSTAPVWQPFVAASIAPEWQTMSAPSQPDVRATLLDLDGSLGVTRLLASHVGLDGELFYRHTHQTSTVASSSATRNIDNYGLRFGLSVFIH